MKKLQIILLAAAAILFTGNAYAGMDKAKLEKKLAKVTSMYEEADKRGYAWTTTGGVLKKAQAALDKGELKSAKKFIMQAKKEAKGSLAQADDADKNWQAYIPK